MSSPSRSSVPLLHHLPASLPLDGALRLELQDGVPVLRASATVHTGLPPYSGSTRTAPFPRRKQRAGRYEELDEYLSFLNRMVRNMLAPPQR